jgi:hypothetical protein
MISCKGAGWYGEAELGRLLGIWFGRLSRAEAIADEFDAGCWVAIPIYQVVEFLKIEAEVAAFCAVHEDADVDVDSEDMPVPAHVKLGRLK